MKCSCGETDPSKFHANIIKQGSGKCKICISHYQKKWRKANPEKVKARRVLHREYACKKAKEWRKANPHKVKHANDSYRLSEKYESRKILHREVTKALKQKCVDYLGGKCQACGRSEYLSGLSFHHIDPNTKEFEITRAIQALFSWERLKPELDKCIVLDEYCHRGVHTQELLLPLRRVVECL